MEWKDSSFSSKCSEGGHEWAVRRDMNSRFIWRVWRDNEWQLNFSTRKEAKAYVEEVTQQPPPAPAEGDIEVRLLEQAIKNVQFRLNVEDSIEAKDKRISELEAELEQRASENAALKRELHNKTLELKASRELVVSLQEQVRAYRQRDRMANGSSFREEWS